MQTLKKFYFGKQKAKVNTYIGGIGGAINTPALLAAKLGIAENRIKRFKVTGLDVECAIIGGSYAIQTNAFKSNIAITYFNDDENLVQVLNTGSFSGCTSLSYFVFNSVIRVDGGVSVGDGAFEGCTNLTNINLPLWVSAGATVANKTYIFRNCTNLISINAPAYSGLVGNNMFNGCISLTTINMAINGSVGNLSYVGTKITSIDLSIATTLGTSAFENVNTLTGSITANMLTTISNFSFKNTRITSFSSSSCLSTQSGVFANNPNITSISMTALSSITGGVSFTNGLARLCTGLLSVNFPELTTLTGFYHFDGCSSITNIYMPKVTTLGNSVSVLNNIFKDIKIGCSITVPISMQTINSGAPHVDISYAINTRGAIITYV